jgi:hypothetical protein
MFKLDGPDGSNCYWRDLRKAPQYFSKRNFGSGTLKVWGAFTKTEVLTLAYLSTQMNSREYPDVLEEDLIPFLNNNNNQQLLFQQDNGQKHVSRKSIRSFEVQNIDLLE